MTMDQHETTAATAAAVSPGPGPVPVVAVKPRARSSGILNILLVGAAIVAAGGVAFAVGRSTAPVNAFQRIGADPGGNNAAGPRGSFSPGAGPGGPTLSGGGGVSMDGTVKSIDADSLTLTLANGDEVTFTLDSSTTYRQATAAGATDVAVGDDVSVKVAGDGRTESGNAGAAPVLKAGDITVSR